MEGLQAVSVVLYLTVCVSAARTYHAPFVSSKAPRGKTMNERLVGELANQKYM